MRYGLWINVKNGGYIWGEGANNVRTLKNRARNVNASSFIYDHARDVKVWRRDADGTEAYDDKTYRYLGGK